MRGLVAVTVCAILLGCVNRDDTGPISFGLTGWTAPSPGNATLAIWIANPTQGNFTIETGVTFILLKDGSDYAPFVVSGQYQDPRSGRAILFPAGSTLPAGERRDFTLNGSYLTKFADAEYMGAIVSIIYKTDEGKGYHFSYRPPCADITGTVRTIEEGAPAYDCDRIT